MFIAKFNQVNNASGKFEADKNGNLPFIGEVLAGKAKSTLINGTVFPERGFKTNKLYACQNVQREVDGEIYDNCEIIAEVSVMDFIELKKELGQAVNLRSTEEVEKEDSVEVEA